MDIVKSALPFIMICYAIIFFPVFLRYIKTKQKKKKPKPVYQEPHKHLTPPQEPGLGNVIDWDTINAAQQNPSTSWTSWTTTVSSSGEVFLEKAPGAENMAILKENVQKDPVKLKTRFELLKEKDDLHADKPQRRIS